MNGEYSHKKWGGGGVSNYFSRLTPQLSKVSIQKTKDMKCWAFLLEEIWPACQYGHGVYSSGFLLFPKNYISSSLPTCLLKQFSLSLMKMKSMNDRNHSMSVIC